MIPDYFEPITAWRAWRVQANGLLSGLAAAQPWAPKRAMVAVCNGHEKTRAGDISAHLTAENEWLDSPAYGCVCGIYAAKQRDAAETEARRWIDHGYWKDGTSDTYAVGAVSLWGRVIEHEHGYRAQFGYPKALTVYGKADMAAKVAALYGIEATHEQEPTYTPWTMTIQWDTSAFAQVQQQLADALQQQVASAFAVPQGFLLSGVPIVYGNFGDDKPLTFQERKQKRIEEKRARHKERLLQQRRGWKKATPWP